MAKKQVKKNNPEQVRAIAQAMIDNLNRNTVAELKKDERAAKKAVKK